MRPALAIAMSGAAIGAGFRPTIRPPVPRTRLPAEVRFANHLPDRRTWSLASNGTILFADVAQNSTTAYVAVTDTTVHLTLHQRSGDSAVASTNYLFVAGSYYTVTATYGNGDRPELAVERDRPPGDTASHRQGR